MQIPQISPGQKHGNASSEKNIIFKQRTFKSLGQLSESRTMQLKSRQEHKRNVFLSNGEHLERNPSSGSSINKSV